MVRFGGAPGLLGAGVLAPGDTLSLRGVFFLGEQGVSPPAALLPHPKLGGPEFGVPPKRSWGSATGTGGGRGGRLGATAGQQRQRQEEEEECLVLVFFSPLPFFFFFFPFFFMETSDYILVMKGVTIM